MLAQSETSRSGSGAGTHAGAPRQGAAPRRFDRSREPPASVVTGRIGWASLLVPVALATSCERPTRPEVRSPSSWSRVWPTPGHAVGGMRERTNRTVSKTVVSQGTVGSNPTPSARCRMRQHDSIRGGRFGARFLRCRIDLSRGSRPAPEFLTERPARPNSGGAVSWRPRGASSGRG